MATSAASAMTRRRLLATLAGSAAVVAGCGSRPPGAVAEDGSVTVAHLFGETRIPAPPTRVVSAGLTDADGLLALGVVPVAVTDWFGAQPFGVWPWAQSRLGGARPAVLNLADGVQVPIIAGLRPDLIVATTAGLDRATYDALAAIAPTVAQSGREPYFEPWRVQAATIGQATFKADEMRTLISGVDAALDRVKDNNPQFADRRVLLLAGTLAGDRVQVSAPDWRHDFLTAMGLSVVEVADSPIPRAQTARVLDSADILIWQTESDQEQAALLADPVIAGLRATGNQRNVFTGAELSAAIAYASPLSYPVVADRLPPLIAAALG